MLMLRFRIKARRPRLERWQTKHPAISTAQSTACGSHVNMCVCVCVCVPIYFFCVCGSVFVCRCVHVRAFPKAGVPNVGIAKKKFNIAPLSIGQYLSCQELLPHGVTKTSSRVDEAQMACPVLCDLGPRNRPCRFFRLIALERWLTWASSTRQGPHGAGLEWRLDPRPGKSVAFRKGEAPFVWILEEPRIGERATPRKKRVDSWGCTIEGTFHLWGRFIRGQHY